MAALYTSVVISVFEWIFADIKEFDDEEDFLDDLMELGFLLGTREDSKPRILGYVEKVVPLYYDQDFRRHFRLSRSTFDVLVHKASTWKELSLDRSRGGRVAIPVVNQLLITLWYLGSQETFRQLSDRFGVAESTVHGVVRKICRCISFYLRHTAIQRPRGSQVDRIRRGFENIKGFPDVLGAIDGSHIPIKPPSQDRDSYINRKKFSSLILQAVCDHNMFFLDCYCGWPGSVHDARVLRNSDLFVRIQSNSGDMFPMQGTHILGDAAYPLNTWLLTPYKDYSHMQQEDINYNYCHSATRMVIERAFSLLKGRWRKMKFVDVTRVKEIPTMIIASCVLHNICLSHDEDISEFLGDDDSADTEVNGLEIEYLRLCGADFEAVGKRDQIKQYINSHARV